MKSIIDVIDVSFEFSNGRDLFNGLNFSLAQKNYGLVGPNGVGKTSLAKLLNGELQPTNGAVFLHEPVVFVKQREDPKPITVDEALGAETTWSLLRERLLGGIPADAICTNLSGGQWMRVRLARAIDEPFLILDEPTNDLDRESRKLLVDFLEQRNTGALIISHDRELLGLCDEILELSNRGLTKFGFGWSTYIAAKETESVELHRVLDVAKRERTVAEAARADKLARQAKRNRQGTSDAARGGMPKILRGARKRNAQVTSGEVDVTTLEKSNNAVRIAHEALAKLKIDPVMFANFAGEQIPHQKLVAEANGFNVHLRDWVFETDLEFCWRGPIRKAIKGKNGSGKSTLLKAILGETFETKGQLRTGLLKTLSVDQQCATLNDSRTILENVQEVACKEEAVIRNELAKFLFLGESVFQKVADLSGGERLRATLAKGFLEQEKPQLMILDEPTNNLDLINVEFLEALIRGFRGAVIVVSHDDVFLKNCGIEDEWCIEKLGDNG